MRPARVKRLIGRCSSGQQTPRTLAPAVALLCALASGCASLGALDQARLQARQGVPEQALATLDNTRKSAREALLYAMETGAIAHQAGQLGRSVQSLLEAARIMDEQDRISLRDQSVALLANDQATSYRGEYAERLWVHTLQMMNFLLLGNPESAAVEARQALRRLDDHSVTLAGDTFTRALIALSFEAMGNYDSAHIEYRKLLDGLEGSTPLARVAARNARRAGQSAAAKRFTRQGPPGQMPIEPGLGELVVFLEAGEMARKASGNLVVSLEWRIAFPYYPPTRHWPLEYRLNGAAGSTGFWQPVVQTDLVDLARHSLEARGKALAARQLARLGTRVAISDAVGDEYGQAAESLVTALFFLLEQADTRSWTSLPASWGLLRLPLAVGHYDELSLQLRYGPHQSEVALGPLTIERNAGVYRALPVQRAGPILPVPRHNVQPATATAGRSDVDTSRPRATR